ncbi:protein mab-21-like 2 [Acropora palmata]|uniref:protein mab-21-like 2 n=1 Tax=Acropora palmata TaxID=6131 RepID=UPI003DA05733
MAFVFPEHRDGLQKFMNTRVRRRKSELYKTITNICTVVGELLKHVEALEPRFISSLKLVDGRYQGVKALSPLTFEVHLYLNQMGVFNFIDEACPPGCAMLKLSDERKRSMSLWTEFITASGYLSARKVRSRFTSLVSEAIRRGKLQNQIRVSIDNHFSAKLIVLERYTVDLIPCFRCGSIWPQNGCCWPCCETTWPSQSIIDSIKLQGFSLLAKDPFPATKGVTTEGDAWLVNFTEAEEILFATAGRKLCLSILKTLYDQHLDLPGKPLEYIHLVTLLLHECEKHPRESEWTEDTLLYRINGILLQLVSCLQCRKCPHFFLRDVDLFRSKSKQMLDVAAKQVWNIARDVATNPGGFDSL